MKEGKTAPTKFLNAQQNSNLCKEGFYGTRIENDGLHFAYMGNIYIFLIGRFYLTTYLFVHKGDYYAY